MIRVLLTGVIIDPAGEGLLSGSWPAPALQEIERHLRSIDLISDLRFGFESERALTTFALSQIKTGGLGYWRNGTGSKVYPILFTLMPGIIDQNLVRINEWHDKELAHLSIDGSSGRTHSMDRPTRNWFTRYYWALSDASLFSIADQETFAWQQQASIALCRCACAAERYRLLNGRYPDGIDALVPEYLPQVPEDPFGAGKIRSLNRDGALLFYSVGPAGRNESGEMEELTWRLKSRD